MEETWSTINGIFNICTFCRYWKSDIQNRKFQKIWYFYHNVKIWTTEGMHLFFICNSQLEFYVAILIVDYINKTTYFSIHFCSHAGMQTSKCVTLDLLTFDNLEQLRSSQRAVGQNFYTPRPVHSKHRSHKANRWYLILTYNVEFDR